jgi:signal transduction histidine kinase
MNADLSDEDLIALNRLATIARVLAGTAHDVNNALQIISGSAEMLAGQPEMTDLSRRAIQRIQTQSARAAAAVTEVMQFAREQGDAAARVSLRDVGSRAAMLRAYAVRRAGLRLEFDADGVPPALVNGHRAQLLQAVLNLIMTAEQALRGMPEGTIRLAIRETPDAVRLTVTDGGRGLPPELSGRLFEPFVSTHPVPDTPGLGLTAARLIARAHGGEVTVANASPGCEATLRLPPAGARDGHR